jgi:Fe-S oxidoreductase
LISEYFVISLAKASFPDRRRVLYSWLAIRPTLQPPAPIASRGRKGSIPTVESNPGFEYLFWVGCAASFDPRAQKVARATAQLLKEGGVNFAVLGKDETCTGYPARRIGDEFLFQERAQANIETLGRRKVKKIVTPCPHCHNTLKNEYPQFGGQYEVQHHSSLLAELVAAGN